MEKDLQTGAALRALSRIFLPQGKHLMGAGCQRFRITKVENLYNEKLWSPDFTGASIAAGCTAPPVPLARNGSRVYGVDGVGGLGRSGVAGVADISLKAWLSTRKTRRY